MFSISALYELNNNIDNNIEDVNTNTNTNTNTKEICQKLENIFINKLRIDTDINSIITGDIIQGRDRLNMIFDIWVS
jgi:hypothetical protein